MQVHGSQEWQRLREAHLIETEQLAALLQDGAPSLRVVDMRGNVQTETGADGAQTAHYLGAEDDYRRAHIPGAIYLNWTTDLADETDPVPAQAAPPEKLAAVLGSRGIGNESLVVAYDDHPASQFATRLWWLLRYYGHRRALVLNGGWGKWTAEGRPTTAALPNFAEAHFAPRIQPDLRATAEQVLGWLGRSDVTIVDARDEGQFTGKIRRGLRGGRIPGARPIPREALIGPDRTFRAAADLAAIANEAHLGPGDRVVAYCNGGVAATSVLFALSMLGFPNLTNYDGSWNEWNQREELPVETGEYRDTDSIKEH